MKRALFGQLLTEGIRTVAARTGKPISVIENEIAVFSAYSTSSVQRWRLGHIPVSEFTIASLAHFFQQNGLNKTWVERFLIEARYPDYSRVIQELFPSTSELRSSKLLHNLPNLPPVFIGRRAELEQLVNVLTNSRFYVVSIEGVGGIGKTTLALEAAQLLSHRKIPAFEAIIWLTATEKTESVKSFV